ncbi:MAG: hypothetical protein K0S51_2278 [Bacillales bacterium]|jgi:DNA replication protein DnaC|nr:hypothetical protein [Bacillales bacterium]
MQSIQNLLHDRFKNNMKYHIKEIAERDDYDARMASTLCAVCNGEANIAEYRIHGTNEWIPIICINEIKCKSCTDKMMLSEDMDYNKHQLHDQLNNRFGKEYWYIPEDLKKAGFKNFYIEGMPSSIYEAKISAIEYVKNFLENPDKRYNLVLLGNPGTGKTHLATAIARTIKDKGFLVGYITTGALLAKIKATYQQGASKTEESILNDLGKFDLLILDDIGSEARSTDEFDWSKNKLFEIVNKRIGKPTIYTSNLNEKYLPTAIGERVFSRLHNNTRFIELLTGDYRMTLQIK